MGKSFAECYFFPTLFRIGCLADIGAADLVVNSLLHTNVPNIDKGAARVLLSNGGTVKYQGGEAA